MNGAQRLKQMVFSTEVVSLLGLFLLLRPFQLTRLIARSIAETGTSLGSERRKIKPSKRVCIPPQALIGTPALRHPDKTNPYSIFRATLHDKRVHQPLLLPLGPIHPVLQTVKREYSRAVDYRPYHLVNRFACYNKTMSSYIFKMVKPVKSQKKEHFLYPSNRIPIIKFRATLNLLYDTNNIRDRAAKWLGPFFVKNAPSNDTQQLYVRCCSRDPSCYHS